MAVKPETRLQRKIRKGIQKAYPGWWKKIHGGPYQAAGIPDLIGVTHGVFFAFEVKHPDEDHPVTPLQAKNIRDINKAGGHAMPIETLEEALDEIRRQVGVPAKAR